MGKAIVVALVLLCACDKQREIDELGMRVAKLEGRVEALTEKLQARMSDEQLISMLRGINESIGSHEDQLQRMQSYMLINNTTRTPPRWGWWCGVAQSCGRSPRECQNHDLRTVSLDGPNATGSDCKEQKTAWCPKGNTLFGVCRPTRCDDCEEIE
jgi:hypothetical protein